MPGRVMPSKVIKYICPEDGAEFEDFCMDCICQYNNIGKCQHKDLKEVKANTDSCG